MKKTTKQKTSRGTTTNANAVTGNDLKNAVLIVSLLINLAVLTTWLVARLSPAAANALSALVR